ncbi:MAG TPA: hypothetical protein VJK51_02855 [Candidatus Nanoarchaeia archaeon]|nr:hypothetical protein [Candidatus Nanoarchaeia archaeon]
MDLRLNIIERAPDFPGDSVVFFGKIIDQRKNRGYCAVLEDYTAQDAKSVSLYHDKRHLWTCASGVPLPGHTGLTFRFDMGYLSAKVSLPRRVRMGFEGQASVIEVTDDEPLLFLDNKGKIAVLNNFEIISDAYGQLRQSHRQMRKEDSLYRKTIGEIERLHHQSTFAIKQGRAYGPRHELLILNQYQRLFSLLSNSQEQD